MLIHLETGWYTKLAKDCGMSPQYLNDILARRRWAPRNKVYLLHVMCKKAGINVPVEDWCLNKYSSHPIFKGEPLGFLD